MDRPDKLPALTENLRKNMENPVLSPEQANLLDSGYVDNFDEALELLEKSEQVKPDYLDKPYF